MQEDERIVKLLDGFKKEYIIPDYQRDYAWEDDEIERLIKDIVYSTGDYCLGIITTYHHELVDGQQRLTTLYLIAICCGVITKKEEINLKYVLNEYLNNANNLERIISGEDMSMTSIGHGLDIIKDKIKDCKDVVKEKLGNLYYYEIELDDEIDLNHYFEVMNSRGVQLSATDVVKSLLMRNLSSNNQVKLNNLWYEIEKMTMNNSITTFERYSNVKGKTKTIKEIIESNKSYNSNGEETKEDENGLILNFEYFLLYVFELYDNKCDENRTKDKEFDLDELINKYDDKFARSTEKEKIDFIDFLLCIKYIYFNYIVSYNKREQSFSIRVNNDKMKNLQSCMRVSFTSRKSMDWLYVSLAFLKKELDKIGVFNKSKWKFPKNKEEICQKYIRRMEMYIRENHVEDYLNRFKDNYLSGFDTPHIILNYLDYLILINKNEAIKIMQEQLIGKLNLKNYSFKFRNSIEHFYPRYDSEKGKYNPEFVHNIGNLALLDYQTNTRLQNPSPRAKATELMPNIERYSLKFQLMMLIATSEDREWDNLEIEKLGKSSIELLKKDLIKLN